MTEEEMMRQVEAEYAAKFGDPDLPGLPLFFEQQLPDNVKTTKEICAYIRKRIANNEPFEEEKPFV